MSRCVGGCSPVVRVCQRLNRLKRVEADVMATSLQRCLSTLDLALLGVGGMVGSGLYVLTGTVAKDTAGPAVVLSFLLAGAASLLAALCYAEFGARLPKTGSAYMFTYVSVGELWAFLIGWNVILEYMIGGAAVARAWSGYLDAILDHRVQNFTETHVMRWNVAFLARSPDLLACGVLLLASAVISFGVRVSSWLNHVFSAVSLAVVAFVLVFGLALADPQNWGAREGGFAPFGVSGVLAGTATCFYAFVGFDVIAASSEEARDPQRAIPMATGISLGLAAGAYVLVSAVLTLMVPWHTLDPNAALADAFYRRGYSWAGFIVAVGSICAMNTVLLSNLFSLPRIVYAMAEDGLFFSVFARVNPVTKVPVVAILVFGALMALMALLFDLEALVQFLSIGTLLAYTFVAASVIVLRFQPERKPAPDGGGQKTDASSTPPTTATASATPSPGVVAAPTAPTPSAPPPPPPPPRPADETLTLTTPDGGEPKEYESFSDKLQLVQRERSDDVGTDGADGAGGYGGAYGRSTGQLRACWDPWLGGALGGFGAGEVVTLAVAVLMVSAVSLCSVLAFGFSALHLPSWSYGLLVTTFTSTFILSLVLIWAHQQSPALNTFQVPMVPFVPGLSILMNVFLMLKLSPLTWIRFTVWLAAGLLVYFGYGMWHSKEGLREQQEGLDVAARYVVLPSGSLVETVQSVQPEGQEHTHTHGHTDTDSDSTLAHNDHTHTHR
ncbi:cationic amino acid transporter 4 [Sardina pilchardus]|uniref:cationic amino acid transporter 4 n=1 Tax=Sardina pilchardus TaxID=27697 RepID=UPI002E11B04A